MNRLFNFLQISFFPAFTVLERSLLPPWHEPPVAKTLGLRWFLPACPSESSVRSPQCVLASGWAPAKAELQQYWALCGISTPLKPWSRLPIPSSPDPPSPSWRQAATPYRCPLLASEQEAAPVTQSEVRLIKMLPVSIFTRILVITNLWIRTEALPLIIAVHVTIPVQRPSSGQKRFFFIWTIFFQLKTTLWLGDQSRDSHMHTSDLES